MINKNSFTRTKIICTLGPATSRQDIIEKLVNAGMDVVRLNFSHGSHEEQLEIIKNVRKVSEKLKEEICIIQDLCGPKIRTGKVKNGYVEIKSGDHIVFTTEEIEGDGRYISTNYKGLVNDVNVGDIILIDDGKFSVEVLNKSEKEVECLVLNGGILKSNKGIEDVKFGIANGVDYIALSFVRSAEDVKQLRSVIKQYNDVKIPIIAKIEMKEAIESIDSIISVSDAVMVARGDLGVEMMPEEVPILQKMIVKKCNDAGVPVIIATQMLESMINNPRPTRAEASDVANAVLDGADAVMLSAETSVGKYPVEAVQTMDTIVRRAETQLFENLITKYHETEFLNNLNRKEENVFDAVAYSACILAKKVDAKAIIPITHSGATAIRLSKYRPSARIVAITGDSSVVRRLGLVWGVRGIVIKDLVQDKDKAFRRAMEILKKDGYMEKGDFVVFTAGLPLLAKGTTDTINVEKVE